MAHADWSDEHAVALAGATGVMLRRDPETRAQFSDDFGHLARVEPWAVASPRDVDELSQVVRFAAARKLRICARGRGYSQSGQSLSPGGVSLDLSRLDRIEAVDTHHRIIHCQSGARWRDVVTATLQHGLIPAVLPLNLDMSVGGLLSVGGIGANSHRWGVVASQVAELDVVTAAGVVARCAADVQPDLFGATLAGLGRCAVITRATLTLRPVPPRVRTFHLLYDEIQPWLTDQERLVREQRAQYIEAMCWTTAKGFRMPARPGRAAHWMYGLQVGMEYDQLPSDSDALVRELSAGRLVHVDDEGITQFVHRYQPRFDGMRRSGAWRQLHPWIECLLSAERLPSVLRAVLDEVPLSLGDGHRIMWVNPRGKPPLFSAPDCRDLVCVAILPTGVPDAEWADIQPALTRVDHLLREAGGKRYLSGWLGRTDEARWREHYGSAYEVWKALKERFDPDATLQSHLFSQG
jgi:cytokinin dehydrogenase